MLGKKQLGLWTGEFAEEFMVRRGPQEEFIQQRTIAFSQIWSKMLQDPPQSILEVGCNIGLNLRALSRITSAEKFAVEPFEKAREVIIRDQVLPPENLFAATSYDIPVEDNFADLVFTLGVLIHTPPESHEKSYSEIYRAARKYILCIEYHNPDPVEVSYRGHEGQLFKKDFGKEWMELYPDLILVDYGFFWDHITKLDNVTWWLWRKP